MKHQHMIMRVHCHGWHLNEIPRTCRKAPLRFRTRHIGDFTRWKDHHAYQKAFERLLRDLKAEVEAEPVNARIIYKNAKL